MKTKDRYRLKEFHDETLLSVFNKSNNNNSNNGNSEEVK